MKLAQTTQFRKDLRRILRRGKDRRKLFEFLKELQAGNILAPKYRDHKLAGPWVGRHDCHIEADWILIYKVTEDTIILERTGSHGDLF